MSYCRIYARKWRRENAEKWWSYQLKHKFGITIEQYNDLLKQQDGGCAICGTKKELSKRFKRLAVDHDHDSNKIRGILCSYCNQAIGLLRNNVIIAQAALAYLQQHNPIIKEPITNG